MATCRSLASFTACLNFCRKPRWGFTLVHAPGRGSLRSSISASSRRSAPIEMPLRSSEGGSATADSSSTWLVPSTRSAPPSSPASATGASSINTSWICSQWSSSRCRPGRRCRRCSEKDTELPSPWELDEPLVAGHSLVSLPAVGTPSSSPPPSSPGCWSSPQSPVPGLRPLMEVDPVVIGLAASVRVLLLPSECPEEPRPWLLDLERVDAAPLPCSAAAACEPVLVPLTTGLLPPSGRPCSPPAQSSGLPRRGLGTGWCDGPSGRTDGIGVDSPTALPSDAHEALSSRVGLEPKTSWTFTSFSMTNITSASTSIWKSWGLFQSSCNKWNSSILTV